MHLILHPLPAHLHPREEASVQQISVQELAELMVNPGLAEDVQFVDVREQWEFDMSRIRAAPFKLYPLSQFDEW